MILPSAAILFVLLVADMLDAVRRMEELDETRDVEIVRVYEEAPCGTVVYGYSKQYLVDPLNYDGRNDIRVNVLVESGKDDQIDKHFRFVPVSDPNTDSMAIVVGEFPVLTSRCGDVHAVDLVVEEPTGNSIDGVGVVRRRRRKRLHIVVSRRNMFPPRFVTSSVLVADVFRYAVVGSPITITSREIYDQGEVFVPLVEDDDVDEYNRAATFALDTPVPPSRGRTRRTSTTVRNVDDQFGFLTVEASSGIVTAGPVLRRAPGILHVHLVVTNVVSSPPLSTRRSLVVYVCDISEPRNVTVRIIDVYGNISASLCWRRPHSGQVTKYQISIRRISSLPTVVAATDSTQLISNGSTYRQVFWISEDTMSEVNDWRCVELPLSGTRSVDGSPRRYEVQLRAWSNRLRPGLSAFVQFEEECAGSSNCTFVGCRQRSANCTSGDTICDHVDNVTGNCIVTRESCDCSSDVDTRSTALCRKKCRIADTKRHQRRAVVQDASSSVCLNGGTPMSRHSTLKTTQCLCPKPYTGDRCQRKSSGTLSDEASGVSPEPVPCGLGKCRNGGTCRRAESTLDKGESSVMEPCECAVGFFGTQCEHVDRCAAKVCLNGGLCRNLASSDGTTDYHCNCYDGFFGRNCTRFDPCFSSPCQNNGHCRNVSDAVYVCKCRPGFHGDHCELYSPCGDAPCLHGGMCNSIDGRFVCDCEPGRFGRRCERVDPCRLRTTLGHEPCGSHAIACHNFTDTSFKCICEPGWSGDSCLTYNPCYAMPCLNDGTCMPKQLPDTIDRQGFQPEVETYSDSTDYDDDDDGRKTGFQCVCPTGYWGSMCQRHDPCNSSPCLNGGSCVNSSRSRVASDDVISSSSSAVGYRCLCSDWYSGDRCEVAGPCVTADCRNGAACVQHSAAVYRCRCASPCHFGDHCQHYNACCSSPCRNAGRCSVEPGGRYSCRCPAGYRGGDCQLYDPCASSPCRHGGRCTALSDETFRCTCADRYYGETCQELDVCHTAPCRHEAAICVNVPPGGYRCQCPAGTYGPQCETTDPCADQPCRNGGSCSIVDGPLLLPGSGDVDSTGASLTHGGSVVARKRLMSYRCECASGFFGKDCESIDPCLSTPCRHGGTCVPILPPSTIDVRGAIGTVPSQRTYMCRCDIEFEGPDCQDETPCNTHGKRCYNDGVCLRRRDPSVVGGDPTRRRNGSGTEAGGNGGAGDRGNGMYCQCPEGYSGSRCQDFDPCSLDNTCTNGGTCQLIENGMAHCTCPSGFFGDHCELHRPCNVYSCKNNATCIHTPHSDVCYCKAGFAGRYCEIDLEECQSNPCVNGGSCIDLPGRYECSCLEGFAGENCQRADTCPREVVLTAKGRFTWPSTTHGDRATVACPRNPDSLATRRCALLDPSSRSPQDRRIAHWDEPNLTQCTMAVRSVREATDALIVHKTQSFDDPLTIADTVQLLEAVIYHACEDRQVASHLVDLIDRLLEVDATLIHRSNSTTRLLDLMERFLSSVKWLESNVTFVAENIEMDLRYITWMDHEHGASFTPRLSPSTSITIPSEVFHRDVASERLKFIYFRSNKLFPTAKGVVTRYVHEVISASVGQEVSHDLKKCVRFVFPNKQVSRHSRCVFWDEIEKTWSTEGITTESYRGGRTVCCSSHFSFFAVTKDPEVARVSFVQEDVDTTLATYCGLGFAIFCHLVLLLIYVIVRSLNVDSFGQTIIQLTGSMLALDVCLLVAYNRHKFDSVHPCTAVALLTHFFTLASFLWITVTGHCLLVAATANCTKSMSPPSQSTVTGGMITTVAGNSCRSMSLRLLFAWGIPIIPVAATLLVDVRSYQRNTDSCLLLADNKYVFCSVYLLPAAVALVTNCVIGIVVVAKLCHGQCCARFGDKAGSMMANTLTNRVPGFVIVSTLVALSWFPSVAGSLPRYADHVVRLQYWHCAGRSLTAFVTLIVFGLAAPETRSACRRYLPGGGVASPSTTAMTSSSASDTTRTSASSHLAAQSTVNSTSCIAPVGRQQAARASESRRRAAGVMTSSTTMIDDGAPQIQTVVSVPLVSMSHGECTGSNRRKPNVTRLYVASMGNDDDDDVPGVDESPREITNVGATAAAVTMRASASSLAPASIQTPGKTFQTTGNGMYVAAATAGYTTMPTRRLESHGSRNTFSPSPFARRANPCDTPSLSANGNDVCRPMMEFDNFRCASLCNDGVSAAPFANRPMGGRGHVTQRHRPPAPQRHPVVEAYGGESVFDASLVHTSV